MERFWVAWGTVAVLVVVYWFFMSQTARRWNSLLRRAGRAPDDDAIRRAFKLPLFILSSAHREFRDPKLSRLVTISRVSMALAFLSVLAFWSLSLVAGA